MVQLVDAGGAFVGSVPTARALALAREAGLDLVEVQPNAEPHPVCKIFDFKRHRYQSQQQARSSSAARSQMKDIRISVLVAQHDLDVKMEQIQRILSKGDSVKLTISCAKTAETPDAKSFFDSHLRSALETADVKVELGTQSVKEGIFVLSRRRK